MARNVQEPKVTPATGRSAADGEHDVTHPAYGQVRVERFQTTGAVLYGSDHEQLGGVRLVVSGSSLTRKLSRDWPHEGEQILVAEMSHMQWAQIVSGAGSSEGTQATLRRVRDGKLVSLPELPLRDAGGPEHSADAERTLQATVKAVADLRATVVGMKGLTKRDRDAILGGLDTVDRKLTDSLPHILRSFSEHIEERIRKATIDIQAWWHDYRGRQGIGRDATPPLAALAEPGGPSTIDSTVVDNGTGGPVADVVARTRGGGGQGY